MSQIKRARSPDDKARRAATIVRAAREIEAQTGFADMAVAAVAERAGVAKGTVFLYFATKEALGLALLEELLDEWFAALRSDLAATGGREPDARSVARRIAGSVAGRPALARLLAIFGSVLEHNAGAEEIGAFRRRLLGRMRETGTAVEGTLPFLSRGDGLQLQLYVLVLVVGLHALAEPPAAAREALAAPELAPLRLDFAGSLESALRVHLEGLRSLRRMAES